MDQKSRPVVVAAIDFGTTYSGWAFSFLHEFESDPTKVTTKHWTGGQLVSLKGPTTALIRQDDETLDSFGFDAETKYMELEDKDGWYFFQRFKMTLFDNTDLNRHIMLTDVTGKSFPAIKVFSLCIKYLKEDFMETIKDQTGDIYMREDEIRVVLTVPAIWSDAAKQFMREAAIAAGIRDDTLVIALEPEAASIFCRHLSIRQIEGSGDVSMSTLQEGTKYIVLDAGGGTVDVTVHEVLENGHLKEIHAASGGAWGGTKVDEAFVQFLEVIAGKEVIEELQKTYPEEFLDLMRDFEVRKRKIKSSDTQTASIRLPSWTLATICSEMEHPSIKDTLSRCQYQGSVTLKRDRLIIDSEIFKGFFSDALDSIVRHIAEILEQPEVEDCFGILMVGGFAEASLLRDRIRSTFREKKIIVPQDPGLAILKGAVVFGHRPESISQRISRFTYGVEALSDFNPFLHPPEKKVFFDGKTKCSDIFSTLIKFKECLRVGQRKYCGSYTPPSRRDTYVTFVFYVAKETEPSYVTDEGCTRVGKLSIDTPVNTDSERNIHVTVIFGGTEIKVECMYEDTGETKHHVINFLG